MRRCVGRPAGPGRDDPPATFATSASDVDAAVAAATGLTKADAAKATEAAPAGIQTALSRGDKVSIAGSGAIERVRRAQRDGRNPQTGEAIKIAAGNVVKLKPAKGLKDAVDG